MLRQPMSAGVAKSARNACEDRGESHSDRCGSSGICVFSYPAESYPAERLVQMLADLTVSGSRQRHVAAL